MTEAAPGGAPESPYGIVAIAASAGGVRALGRVFGGLPSGFPVPVVVVQHLDPRHRTIIAEVLGRRTKLPVRLATEASAPSGERSTSPRRITTCCSASTAY